jgi:hypothetical protein
LRWSTLRLALVGLFFARGIALLCVIPPFSGWDEYQHFAYVEHLANTGARPVLGETSVSDSVLRGVLRYPAPRHAVEQLADIGVVDYEAYWRLAEAPRYSPPARPIDLYESQHDPLGYAWMVPIFRLAGGSDRAGRSLAVLRFANLLLASLAIWIILGCLARRIRDPVDALGVGLLVALHPLIGVNAARVANDPLGFLLGTAVIAALLDGVVGSLRGYALRSAAIGVGIGLAIRAKALNLPLVPFLALTLVGEARKTRRGSMRALLCAGVSAAAIALVLAPEIARNLDRFGLPVGIRDVVASDHSLPEFAAAARSIPWTRLSIDLWMRQSLFTGAWSGVRAPSFWRHFHAAAVSVSILGLLALARRTTRKSAAITSGRTLVQIAVLCLLFHLELAVHALLMHSAWNITATNFWYATAAIPWWLLLLYQGGVACLGGAWRRALPAQLIAVFVGANLSGIGISMLRVYTQSPPGSLALARLASLQEPAFGSLTLIGASVTWAALAAVLGAQWWRLAAQSALGPEPTRSDARASA